MFKLSFLSLLFVATSALSGVREIPAPTATPTTTTPSAETTACNGKEEGAPCEIGTAAGKCSTENKEALTCMTTTENTAFSSAPAPKAENPTADTKKAKEIIEDAASPTSATDKTAGGCNSMQNASTLSLALGAMASFMFLRRKKSALNK